MKERLVSFAALMVCLIAVAAPAGAQTVYDNGPINGQVDAWNIDTVSNRWSCCRDADPSSPSGGGEVNGLVFGAWLFPGDVLQTVEVSITSSEFGGTTYFDQVVSFTQSGCSTNEAGFNVCTETGSFAGVNLAAGSYWLNLSNAATNDGDPAYWDENSGVGCESPGCPSIASQSELGTIPSESFTLLGNGSGTGGSVPEPSSILLIGSGILGLAGMLRRRF
jgi:hypothetical protein